MKSWVSVIGIGILIGAFPIVVVPLLAACDSPASQEKSNKDWYTNWARAFLDCPSAEVVITYSRRDQNPNWGTVGSFYIIGCGLKVCCDVVRDGSSCVSCKQGQWYGKDN